MRHMRYIVYWEDKEKPQKKVALWTDDVIHSLYADRLHIKPHFYSSLGYIGFDQSGWVLYEHYQLDTSFPLRKKEDKEMVYEALNQFPERNDPTLQAELFETYRQEKHLLFMTIKKQFESGLKILKGKVTSRE